MHDRSPGATSSDQQNRREGREALARTRRMALAAATYLDQIEAVGWEKCPAELRDKFVTAGAHRDVAARAYSIEATGEKRIEIEDDGTTSLEQADLWLMAEERRQRSRQLAAHRRRIAALGREAQRARTEDLAHGVTRRRTERKRQEYEAERDWLDSLQAVVGTHSTGRGRPRGAGRPACRGASRRSAARSGDSGSSLESDEPEPPSGGRLCQCGCGRDISHKRAGAKTFDANCRSRLSRAASPSDLNGFDDDIREERRILWAAAADGEVPGYPGLTEDRDEERRGIDEERRGIDEERRVALSRATTPRPTEMDALAITRWVMESNGVYTGRRDTGSPWMHPEQCLRTRPAVVERVAA